jgi:hypothetical protein
MRETDRPGCAAAVGYPKLTMQPIWIALMWAFLDPFTHAERRHRRDFK